MAPLGIQSCSLAVPAPTRLSPRARPCTTRTMSTYRWGGPCSRGVTPRGAGPGEQVQGAKAPPCLPGPTPLGACVADDSRVQGGVGTGHHGGSSGGGKGRPLPPRTMLVRRGACAKRARIELRGEKYHQGDPPPSSPTPAVVPGSLFCERLWSSKKSMRTPSISPPSPRCWQAGGQGAFEPRGLSRFRGAVLCPPRVLPPRARLLW